MMTLSKTSQAHSPRPAKPKQPAAPNNGERQEVKGEVYSGFPDREGYNENFLGIRLPMPQLDPSIRNSAAPLLADPSQIELKYTHFSVIQNKDRAMPMLTAVNIDGAQFHDLERKGSWVLDSRIAREHQLGNEAYRDNPIDKGHQVRRKDPMWGAVAEKGSGDTFVYTNSGLQHADLNQRPWLDLENNVLNGAVALKEKKTVFTGPILRDDDPTFNNHGAMDRPTKMPMAFWKVEVWNEPGAGLKAEAFVESQKDFYNKEQSHVHYEHIKPIEFQKYRVTMDQLEAMTHIHFGVKDGADRTVSDAEAAQKAGIGTSKDEG
jgi:endonuclease G